MVNFSTEKRTWVKWKWSPLWSSDWIKSGIRFCNLIWKTYCIIIICDHRWRSSISRWFVRRHKKNKSNSHFLSLNDCILHPVSVTATPPLGLYHFCLWWVTPCHTDLFFPLPDLLCRVESIKSRSASALPTRGLRRRLINADGVRDFFKSRSVFSSQDVCSLVNDFPHLSLFLLSDIW